MAFVVNDRVKETSTSTGTGTINLAGAETGFETFVAGIGNSNTTYYCIQAQGGSAFEIGVGTVTDASPDTLSRTAIISSSNGDAAVDFGAGTKDVFCTLPASKAVIEDSSTNADIAGNLTIGGTVDGVDIAARDAVLTSTTTTATNANTTANAALPKAGGTMTGNIVMSGSETVDGVDISARDAVLTSTTTTANAALPKTGGTMTGAITFDSAQATGNSGLVPAAGTSGHFLAHNGAFAQVAYSNLSGTPTVPGGSNGIDFNDDVKARFGTGNDFEIFHQSSDNASIISESGGGALEIRGTNVALNNAGNTKSYVNCVDGGEVTLYHDGNQQVFTTSNGLKFDDNKKALFGDASDFEIYHNGSQTIMDDTGTGSLEVRTSQFSLATAGGSASMILATDGGSVELYHNATKMFSTTTNGVQVEADKRLDIINGTNWSGEVAGKIEHHSNNMYHQFTTTWIARNASGSDVFTVDSSGNGTFNANVTAFSDYRIKEDVKTIDNALDKVCKLRGVEYTRKETKAREIGVIAQEVKEIVPELVAIQNLKSDLNPDSLEDMHTMKYQNTVGLLIEAIKDLKAEIETLKKDK
tara:strand:+ start:715 stop:2469 length:1755 start_codon:yes stop_codon:yes gene_type:complete